MDKTEGAVDKATAATAKTDAAMAKRAEIKENLGKAVFSERATIHDVLVLINLAEDNQ